MFTTTEGYNEGAATRAFERLYNHLEDYGKKFAEIEKLSFDNFDANGGKDKALGGNLGTVALNSFEEMNTNPFNRLKANFEDYMQNQISVVMRNNANVEDAARNTYNG
jgi:hypothetical protein